MKKCFTSFKVLILVLTMSLATSCGTQPQGLPKLPGVQGPIFNVINGQILVTFKFLTLNTTVGGTIPLPKTLNSFVELSPNVLEGGTLAQFYLDINDIGSTGLGITNPETLPDGRPLPGIAGGSLPALAINAPEILDTTFYFNTKLFGLFVPIKNFNTKGLGAYYKIVVNEKDVGLIGLVSSDANGENAGFTLFLKLDALKDKKFRKLIEMSKQNRDRLY